VGGRWEDFCVWEGRRRAHRGRRLGSRLVIRGLARDLERKSVPVQVKEKVGLAEQLPW
jgi:hypothetical protein